MGKYKFLPLILFLFVAFSARAQYGLNPQTWKFIDTSIANKRNLKELLQIVTGLEKKAMADQNYFAAARCIHYQILVADQKTEDTFYFKNSAMIEDQLKNQQPVLQYALHMMQAQRLLNFGYRYNSFNRARYERKDITINYAAYTKMELDSMAMLHFEKAKHLSAGINEKNIDEALWLSSDPLQFLFKPGFFDIAIAEQIKAAKQKYYYNNPRNVTLLRWLGLSPFEFAAKLDSVYVLAQIPGYNSYNSLFSDLVYYGEWLAHYPLNSSTFNFLESVARKYVYELVKQNNDDAEKIYETYLLKISSSPYPEVRAFAVYQLCLLWNSLAQKYFPSSPTGRYERINGKYQPGKNDFDTAYRYHAVKALDLFNQNRSLLDSFSYLKKILLGMEAKIKRHELTLTLQECNLPAKPILAELKFKNADTLNYQVVSLPVNASMRFWGHEETVHYLLENPVVKNGSIKLPSTNDFNYHNIYLDMGEMQAGNYAVIFSHKPVADTLYEREFVLFTVTQIAVVNNDKRVYVLDRKTGKPLSGAKVKAVYEEEKKDSASKNVYHTKHYMVNKQGFITISDNRYTDLTISYGKDSVFEMINIKDEIAQRDYVYDKDEYDDLIDFYESNAKAYIFTDRSIYRPGQTVFYKVIFITKNPKTGEAMLMNKENLEGKLFGSIYKKWLKEETPWLLIKDPFNKQMDSVKIVPNDFGSLAGTFKIPKTAATGEWEIDPNYIDKEYNSGIFKVEEYKRPTYEVTIEKPVKELKPKDDFSFKAKVRSFAGSELNNVKVNYTVTRYGFLPRLDPIKNEEETFPKTDTISDATGFTNSEGELEVFVRDSLLLNYDLDKKHSWTFRYHLEIETADATGESYEAKEDISISSRPVRIHIPLSSIYDRGDLKETTVTAEDDNAGIVSKTIKVKIYRLEKNSQLFSDRQLTKADLWLYDKQLLQTKFPFENLFQKKDDTSKQLVFEKTINTGNKEKLELDSNLLSAGKYSLEASCEENGIITGEFEKDFSVFDHREKKLPSASWAFDHMPYNAASPGDTLKYFYGNSLDETYSIFHVVYYSGKKKTAVKYFYDEQLRSKGLQRYDLEIPGAAVDQVKLTQVYVLENRVFTNTETIYINSTSLEEPEIIIEKYRKKLAPGSKETFTVSIKTKNENVAAEMMTTMYDASLDQLEKHKWEKPSLSSNKYLELDWTGDINSVRKNVPDRFSRGEEIPLTELARKTNPLWWVNPLNYNYGDVIGAWDKIDVDGDDVVYGFYSFQHDMNPDVRWAGLTLANTKGLDEVVVVGAGRMTRRELTGSVSGIMIRGNATISDNKFPVVVNGILCPAFGWDSIDQNEISSINILKGGEAATLYGSKAAGGVIVITTKDYVPPKIKEEIPVVTRKNFNESAFFFPAVHADKDGFYSFSFTMPESVTEWNWKMLAHTKNSLFAYAERKLNTQLPLMVQPNMPRLLYQGDRIVLQSRISNLDTINTEGKVTCKIRDAMTDEDITSKCVKTTQNNFAVAKKSNSSSGFDLRIPIGQVNPVKITITAKAENFADAEEHTIPVLPPKVFVRDSKNFHFSKNSDTSFNLPGLPADAEVYGIGLSIQPKPQAALINSLPYLANYPYGCGEQTFNKILAYTIAIKMMRSDSNIQRSYSKAKQFLEKENFASEKLPGELSDETMPWLGLANHTAHQHKQLFDLLDTSRVIIVINELLEKIYKLQNSNGGLSWFNGGKTDFYISNYVLRGFGELEKNSQLIPDNSFNARFYEFIKGLLHYCDKEFGSMPTKDQVGNALYYSYARSYFLNSSPLTDSLKQKIRQGLLENWKNADKRSLYTQSLLVIASFRFSENEKDELYTKAVAQLSSVRQRAIEEEQNGLRWKDLADNDDLTNSSEETIALLAEAFSEYKNEGDLHKGIIKWLLTAKSEHHWRNTKATAAAVNLLSGEKILSEASQVIKMTANNRSMEVTDDLFSGADFIFSGTNEIPAAIQLHKENQNAANGSFYSYYFTSSTNLSHLNKDVGVQKQFYKWNANENKWEMVTGATQLKIADKVKVVITIQSSKALQYVFIDDKRAAAFEPVNNNSGYEYGSPFNYYRSVRDAGFQYFADFIPSGRTEISYELKVAQEGEFLNGPTVLQCMYKPEITAYSNSSFVKTEK